MARTELEGPWDGWVIVGETLYSPEGVPWSINDLYRWHFERQLLAELKRQQKQPCQYLFEF